MNNVGIRLENVKLHNKIQSMEKSEAELKKNIILEKKNLKKNINIELQKLIKENQKLKLEKEEMCKKYYQIPKWLRNIFSK